MHLYWTLALDYGPRPAVTLAQRPNPKCPQCCGEGFLAYFYGADEDDVCDADPCDCWDSFPRWQLLPLPRRAARWFGWREPRYSTEPPF